MLVSLILAHPDPGSFNHAIAGRAETALGQGGHDVHFHDLYAEGFDPVLPAGEIPRRADLDAVVARHCREIAEADGVIVVHPNWWGMPPAILKGWIDRVVRPDVCYRFLEGDAGEGAPVGLMRARQAVVFNTSNTAAERERAVFGDPLGTIWKNCVFGLCGVPRFYRRVFESIVVSTADERAAWLDEVERTVLELFPAEGGK